VYRYHSRFAHPRDASEAFLNFSGAPPSPPLQYNHACHPTRPNSMSATKTTSVAANAVAASSARRAPSFSAGASHLNRTTVTSTPLPPVTLKIEAAKRLAAYAAVDAFVKPVHKVIGIGSGTTVPYVVERIVQQGEELNADVRLLCELRSDLCLIHDTLTLSLPLSAPNQYPACSSPPNSVGSYRQVSRAKSL
jgi:hypothetical protein